MTVFVPPAIEANPQDAFVQFTGLVVPSRTTPLLRVVLKEGDITELLLGVVTYTLFVLSFISFQGTELDPAGV